MIKHFILEVYWGIILFVVDIFYDESKYMTVPGDFEYAIWWISRIDPWIIIQVYIYGLMVMFLVWLLIVLKQKSY